MTCYSRCMTGVYHWLRTRVFPPVPDDIRDDVAVLRAQRIETLTPALFLLLAANYESVVLPLAVILIVLVQLVQSLGEWIAARVDRRAPRNRGA